MLNQLTTEQRALADAMSAISEAAYSAGWMRNVEYVLWNALVNGERKFGRTNITQAEISQLQQLSNLCNCWIYFDDQTEEMPIDLVQWHEKFKAAVEHDPDLLKG